MSTNEPTTIIFLIEGEPTTGTVDDYAKALREAHYAGLDVSSSVWTVNPDQSFQRQEVHTFSTGYDEDDYSTLAVEIRFPSGYEGSSVRIDGRA